jgi:glutamate racemase
MNHPAPIGVFDSGIGGLSILKALRAELPHESFVYFSDSAHAPYGERDGAYVVERSLTIAELLREKHGVKALVVACNTATAVAIGALRARHPDLPVVGVEPAIKPALSQTRTGHIGVLATRRTVGSTKFNELLTTLAHKAHFSVTACDGLAKAIENQNESEIRALIYTYTSATGIFGSNFGEIDTLVLGCTHYPLEHAAFQLAVGKSVVLVEPGLAVARRVSSVLENLRKAHTTPNQPGSVTWLGSAADLSPLMGAARHWLPDAQGYQPPAIPSH